MMVASNKTLSTAEVVELGERIYQEKLRGLLEPAHVGEYVIINVETGEYELDKDHMAASKRARERWPEARRFGARVGYPAIWRLRSFKVVRP